MKRLGVNIDHIATLRQARLTSYPNPLEACELLAKCHVAQVTLHLREDRRHIQDRDLEMILAWGKLPVNLEMAATEEMLDIACRLKPAIVTLVPEKREELTTEGGLDVAALMSPLHSFIRRLKHAGIHVSLFIDPEFAQVNASRELGVDSIEFHTGTYSEFFETAHRDRKVERLKNSAFMAKNIGLRVCAGHGLHRENLSFLVQNIPDILERKDLDRKVERLKNSAFMAKNIGLRVCAGHGLHRENLSFLVQNIPDILERKD